MSTPHSSARPTAHAPGLREATLAELALDLCRLGPAPTRSRELVVIGVTAILLAVLFAVFAPSAPAMIIVSLAIVAYLAVRWTIGARSTWRTR